MPQFAIVNEAADPLRIAAEDNFIVMVDVNGGPVKDFHESSNHAGIPIGDSIKELKPVEEWTVDYDLHDTASLVVAFGVPVNTDYLITGLSAQFSATSRPRVSISCIKPSAAAIIKSYTNAVVNLTLGGGYGVVELFGATAASTDYISSSVSVSMQTAEADHPTSGDYLTGGLYTYGFKKEISISAYSALTLPGGANVTSETSAAGNGAFKVFTANWWEYMDTFEWP